MLVSLPIVFHLTFGNKVSLNEPETDQCLRVVWPAGPRVLYLASQDRSHRGLLPHLGFYVAHGDLNSGLQLV